MEKKIKAASAFQVSFEITLEVEKPGKAVLSKEDLRQDSLRRQSASNLRQLALALQSHADAHRRLPPAAICDKDGKPVLSWRVALLPYIDQEDLFKRFKLDESWDSPHNSRLVPLMPKLFAPVGVQTKEPFTTFYQAFTGPGTALETRRDKNSPFGAWGPSLFTEFRDGTSLTMAIAEAAAPVPWTKPAELEFDAKKPGAQTRRPVPGGASTPRSWTAPYVSSLRPSTKRPGALHHAVG